MRRKLVLSLIVAVTAMSAVAAIPARAQAGPWPVSCIEDAINSRPALGTVFFDEQGRLVVDDTAIPSDVAAISDWAPGAVLGAYSCIVQELPLDSVDCALDQVFDITSSMDPQNNNFRWVYPRPEGGWYVDEPLLRQDVRALVLCHISS